MAKTIVSNLPESVGMFRNCILAVLLSTLVCLLMGSQWMLFAELVPMLCLGYLLLFDKGMTKIVEYDSDEEPPPFAHPLETAMGLDDEIVCSPDGLCRNQAGELLYDSGGVMTWPW